MSECVCAHDLSRRRIDPACIHVGLLSFGGREITVAMIGDVAQFCSLSSLTHSVDTITKACVRLV